MRAFHASRTIAHFTATDLADPGGVSLLCLSCHDGSIDDDMLFGSSNDPRECALLDLPSK